MLALSACSGGHAPAVNAASGAHVAAGVLWTYEVHAASDELAVEATFPPGASDELQLDEDAVPFVHDVSYSATSSPATAWLPAIPRGAAWIAACRATGCRVRYRFALREAARKIDDSETAIASGDVVVAPPSTWLLRPADAPGRFRFHVTVDPPGRFASGTWPSPDGAPDTFEALTGDLDDSSFSVFGPVHPGVVRSVVQAGTAGVEVAIAPQGLALSDADVVAWVRTAVDAIAAYFGRFLADRALVVVIAGQPGNPTRGVTLGAGGPAVLVRAMAGLTASAVPDDWVMTHELLHVVFPTLSREHVWMGEGIPTYLEPIVRARAGLVTPEKFWGDLVEGLPQGLPEAGDEGLERTHTWGRTYWGGALFCLVADVTIRERTKGTRSLDDALRAIAMQGGGVSTKRELRELLDAGDRATGTDVLRSLYTDMALAPGTVDLPALWRRLGVRENGGQVTFDDSAPLASARRGITSGR